LECEDRANHFANLGTIGACPVNEAAIHISELPLAEIGKPESPVSVEHEIVGAARRMLATVRIISLDVASVQIFDLDAAALIVLTLQVRTEGAAFPDPGKPAVVADVHPAVGPHAAPLAPPRMLATTSTRPPGVMRESVSRAISTSTIDPSGMATGPSGNCKPDAMIFMLALKNCFIA
jgi:hypothetical protein